MPDSFFFVEPLTGSPKASLSLPVRVRNGIPIVTPAAAELVAPPNL
jgi:hypothetical protein